MKATIKNFFGTNIEQEVSDPVVILPFAIRNSASGSIVTPEGTVLEDFEEIRVSLGVNANAKVYASDVVSKRLIDGSVNVHDIEWSDPLNANGYSMLLSRHNDKELRWQTASNVSGATCWPIEVVGYKRRISRIGIDELMSAMSLPNLIANADLTDNPINQRGFDGNWAALAVGDYGYDQWMKVSSTHMGAVIEAGKYRPNAKHTLTKDDVVIGEFMSPASGHWTVAVPFATSGKFDLYAGQFKRPWHPVLDGTSLCQRFYQVGVKELEYLTSIYQSTAPWAARGLVNLSRPMRKIVTPSVNNAQWYSAGTAQWATPSSLTLLMRSLDIIWIDIVGSGAGANHQCVIVRFGYVADASITLAELNGQIIYLQ